MVVSWGMGRERGGGLVEKKGCEVSCEDWEVEGANVKLAGSVGLQVLRVRVVDGRGVVGEQPTYVGLLGF
jgi:hypothetical protein